MVTGAQLQSVWMPVATLHALAPLDPRLEKMNPMPHVYRLGGSDERGD